jgi:hypothetical protein
MGRRLLTLCVALAAWVLPSGLAIADVERSTLRDVSLAIMDLYNAEDGIGLYTRLSEPLAVHVSTELLAERLSDCRQKFGSLKRLSLPVLSTETAALFAAYFETGARDMYLELDRDGGIRLLTFSGTGDNCALIAP